MVEAAALPLSYPETSVVEEESLPEQSLAIATQLPERPVVLGGCCCAHIGAVEALAARYRRLAVVWVDAHGDLNTPETSPSGNLWGMPLRMLVDGGIVAAEDVALVGARNLDPGEEAFIAGSGLRIGARGVEAVLADADAAYVALDADSLDSRDVISFMPERGGLRAEEVEGLFRHVVGAVPVAGVGLSGLAPDASNLRPLERLCGALGL
jgi:arginase